MTTEECPWCRTPVEEVTRKVEFVTLTGDICTEQTYWNCPRCGAGELAVKERKPDNNRTPETKK